MRSSAAGVSLLVLVCLNILQVVLSKDDHLQVLLSRVKRQSVWDSIVNFFRGLFGYPSGGSGAGYPSGGGGYYPQIGGGGYNPPNVGGGGYYPSNVGGGGNNLGGGGRGRVCACQNRGKRQIISKDAETPNVTSDTSDTPDADQPPDGIDSRIVGGHAVSPSQYPQLVKVLLDGNSHCGGTVLNERYILTAAHCVYRNRDPRAYSVQVGGSGRAIPISRAAYNPNYDSTTYNNDIAVLELVQSIPQLQPSCLPTRARDYTGKMGMVVGWGKTSENGGTSTGLQEVDVPILSQAVCKSLMSRYTITDNMLCAGYQQGGKDSCGGDSGGPAFIVGDRGPLQVGVVSFGEGCARANRPGVYTRIDQQTQFLLNNMPNAQCAIYSIDA